MQCGADNVRRIHKMAMEKIKVTIEGVTPLLFNRFRVLVELGIILISVKLFLIGFSSHQIAMEAIAAVLVIASLISIIRHQ
jgi:hypothetical protein